MKQFKAWLSVGILIGAGVLIYLKPQTAGTVGPAAGVVIGYWFGGGQRDERSGSLGAGTVAGSGAGAGAGGA